MGFKNLSLLMCAALACHNGAAMAQVPVALHLYAGLAQAMSGPKSLLFNTSYPEEDILHKDADSGYGFTGGLGFAYTIKSFLGSDTVIKDVALGLDVFLFNTVLKGDVFQFGSQVLNNFHYHLNLNTTRLMLNAQFNVHPINQMMPFITAGIGPSSVKADYYDTPYGLSQNIDGGVALPRSQGYQLAYSLGAGFMMPVSKKVSMSFTYLYTDMGKVHIDGVPAPYFPGNIDPIRMNLHTQSALVGLTYIWV